MPLQNVNLLDLQRVRQKERTICIIWNVILQVARILILQKKNTQWTRFSENFSGPTNIISTCGNKRPQALTITWASEV